MHAETERTWNGEAGQDGQAEQLRKAIPSSIELNPGRIERSSAPGCVLIAWATFGLLTDAER